MRVVAIVPLSHTRRLENALAGIAEVTHCTTRRDCDRAVEAHRLQGLVVDPALLEYDKLESFVREKRDAGIAVVFYLRLRPASVAAILPLIAEESAGILVADVDESGDYIRAIFDHLPQHSIEADLFAAAAGLVGRVPQPVALALAVVLLDPRWRCTKELPGRIGISRRTVDRALQVAGLAPLHKWGIVARVGRAFATSRDTRTTNSGCVRASGYDDVRSLRGALRLVLGIDSLAQARSMARGEFIDHATSCLQTGTQPAGGFR